MAKAKLYKIMPVIPAAGAGFSISPGVVAELPEAEAEDLCKALYAVPFKSGLTLEKARELVAAEAAKRAAEAGA